MEAKLQTEGWQTALASARAVARQFSQEVRQQFCTRVRAIRLIGSAARGDWTSDSDIDILVLLDEVSEEDRQWLAQRALVLGVLEHGMVLQPIPMAERQYEQLKNRERRFVLDAETEGISL